MLAPDSHLCELANCVPEDICALDALDADNAVF
jgi:hypothetical protein